MGSNYIRGFMESCNISQDELIAIHLESNHYPPVSIRFLPVAKRAIELANAGEWDEVIEMPNGKELSVSQIVKGLHLESFIREEEI